METSTKEILEEKILKVLEAVKPYLQADGGDISYINLTDDMTVQVQLHGACNSCPMSIQTLKFGVEQALINAIPEIKNVEAVDFSM
jgi:Fe-S cluster biogenesis protein NfuA